LSDSPQRLESVQAKVRDWVPFPLYQLEHAPNELENDHATLADN
jgi:hypothetical protein